MKPAVPVRIFVPFFAGSLLLTLTWGATLGMINLARLTAGWGLGSLPRSSVSAHGYVQVFGFMALFIMGVAYHVVPRIAGTTLQRARLVPWSFWLQLIGVVVIACGFFHDGPATQPLWIAGSALLFAAGVCSAPSCSERSEPECRRVNRSVHGSRQVRFGSSWQVRSR